MFNQILRKFCAIILKRKIKHRFLIQSLKKMGSNAVSQSAISRIVGWIFAKGNFSTTSPNLPQSVNILSEGNDANQGTMPTIGTPITTPQQAGKLFGYGSPIYSILRILLPLQGGGLQGIPINVFALPAPGGATAKEIEITPSGVATSNGTHTLIVSGREGIDAQFYSLNIKQGDSTAEITAYISDVVNNILGAPCSASDTSYEATLTTKWKGLTANEFNVIVDTGNNTLGISYSIVTTQAGSGTPNIASSLAQFGSAWNTIVVNGFGTESNTMAALEAFNGIPDPENPTGRYTGIIMKPMVALTGTTLDDPSSITDSGIHPDNVTITICPAPGSAGFSFEAAANVCALYAPQAQNSPQLDIAGQPYPDMPAVTQQQWASATMSTWNGRQAICLKGCSTVDLLTGSYVMQDFITTYHPDGETPPIYRYVRDLNIMWNIRFSYYLQEQLHVVNHVIAGNNDIVTADNVIRPKDWVGILFTLATQWVSNGWITDATFTQTSIVVALSTTNQNRIDTTFNVKLSGFARITATTATVGFNFGS